jgi:hypothetical protein
LDRITNNETSHDNMVREEDYDVWYVEDEPLRLSKAHVFESGNGYIRIDMGDREVTVIGNARLQYHLTPGEALNYVVDLCEQRLQTLQQEKELLEQQAWWARGELAKLALPKERGKMDKIEQILEKINEVYPLYRENQVKHRTMGLPTEFVKFFGCAVANPSTAYNHSPMYRFSDDDVLRMLDETIEKLKEANARNEFLRLET